MLRRNFCPDNKQKCYRFLLKYLNLLNYNSMVSAGKSAQIARRSCGLLQKFNVLAGYRMPESTAETSKPARNLKPLRQMVPYLLPYKRAMAGAFLALLASSSTVLAIGVGLRGVIDHGFQAHDPGMLDHTLLLLFVAILVLAASTYVRFSLVTWLGERVVADLRRAVYDHILKLGPGFLKLRAAAIFCRASQPIPAFCKLWSARPCRWRCGILCC